MFSAFIFQATLSEAHASLVEEITAKEAELNTFRDQLEVQAAEMEQMRVEAVHAAAERHREDEVC